MVTLEILLLHLKIDSGRHIFNEKLKNYSAEEVIEK
jgi:hypothetical protein